MIVSPLSPARSLRALIWSSSARPPRGRRCGSGQPLSAGRDAAGDGFIGVPHRGVGGRQVARIERYVGLQRREPRLQIRDHRRRRRRRPSAPRRRLHRLTADLATRGVQVLHGLRHLLTVLRQPIRHPTTSRCGSMGATSYNAFLTNVDAVTRTGFGREAALAGLAQCPLEAPCTLASSDRSLPMSADGPSSAPCRPRLERHVRYAHTQHSEQIAPSPAHGRAAGTRPGRRGEGPLRRLRMGARLERIAAARGWPGRPDAGSRGRPNSGRGRARAH